MTDEESVNMVLEALRRAGWTAPKGTQVDLDEFKSQTFFVPSVWEKEVGYLLHHMPTGIVITMSHNKSLLNNKRDCWSAMLAILPEEYLEQPK